MQEKRKWFMSKTPIISFIIPTLNSETILKNCLASVRKQNYPKNKIEIICPDGGSSDNSIKIANSFGSRVIKNKKVLAEPGFMLGGKRAKGELIVYMGADNRLSDKNWINNIIKPFQDKEIMGAYPWHKNNPKNTWLTKYFNTFTDPVNHFILGYSCNPLFFYRNYELLKKTDDYVVYSFTLKHFPMIAFDQGFTVRKFYKRPLETEYDDILPVLNLIKEGKQLAFVPRSSNYHFTLEKGLFQYIKKMRWIIDNNISPNATFGLPTRVGYLNKIRRIRFYIWSLYALSILFPLFDSFVGIIRDRKKEWIYHTPITFITVLLVVYEIVRLKVFRLKSLASRQ